MKDAVIGKVNFFGGVKWNQDFKKNNQGVIEKFIKN